MGSKQEKENPDWSGVDLDSCLEKCRKSRRSPKKRPPSRHAKLFCLQSVAAVSVRTHLWQASALSRVGEGDHPWPKKTSHHDHRYRSEISRKMIPFGRGIGETEGVATAGGGLFSEEYAAKSEPLKSWKPRLTNCRKVAFPNVLLDTIASSMIRVCTFRLTRGTP